MGEFVDTLDNFLSNGVVKIALLLLPVATLLYGLFKSRLNYLSKSRYRKKVRDYAVKLSLDVEERKSGSLIYRCLLWVTYLFAFSFMGMIFISISLADMVSNRGFLGLWGALSLLALSFVLYLVGLTFKQATTTLRNGWHPKSRVKEIHDMITTGYKADMIDDATKEFVVSLLSHIVDDLGLSSNVAADTKKPEN